MDQAYRGIGSGPRHPLASAQAMFEIFSFVSMGHDKLRLLSGSLHLLSVDAVLEWGAPIFTIYACRAPGTSPIMLIQISRIILIQIKLHNSHAGPQRTSAFHYW